MDIKMKGVFKLKGFNKKITHIFVVKEREDDEEMEMEIGCPMDVQHVGHIGWDGSAGDAAPSWMDEIKTGPEFTSSSIGRASMGVAAWSSAQEECTSTTEEAAQKKHRRKKQKKSSTSSTTSPRNGSEIASKRRSKLKKGKAKSNELLAS